MSLWNILREHSQSLLVIMGVCGSIFAMGAVYETLKLETKMKETEVFHQIAILKEKNDKEIAILKVENDKNIEKSKNELLGRLFDISFQAEFASLKSKMIESSLKKLQEQEENVDKEKDKPIK
jgi:hypothetical protein